MPDFDYSLAAGIATITLNRPEVLNALTLDMYAERRDLCAALERDMRGHLEFCRMTGHRVRNMRRLPKPIIAAVNRLAAGARAGHARDLHRQGVRHRGGRGYSNLCPVERY